MIIPQVLVGIAILCAVISVLATLWRGGINHNRYNNSWKEWRNWSWEFWLGWFSIALWLVGMFLVPLFK